MDRRNLLYPLSRSKERHFVTASGAECVDMDGKHYLDCDEMSVVLGQGNASFIDKMELALKGYTGSKEGINIYEERLTSYLMEGTKGDFSAVHYTASGSEASEWAVKLARKMTGRTELLSFWNSIHGRTQLSASMSGLPVRHKGYGPLDPGLVFGVYPDCNCCPFGRSCEAPSFYCLEFLDMKLKMESAQDLAAVIIEPYLGAQVAAPPKGFLSELYRWAKRKGAMFILDEVQSGVGRTGRLFFYQSLDFIPDMLLLGKALGNGLHVSALLVRETPDLEALPALAGGTGNDVLAMAAGCAVWEELTQNGLLAHIEDAAHALSVGLELVQHSFPKKVIKVCVLGLAASIRFSDEKLTIKIHDVLTKKGFLLGRRETILTIKPPYCITSLQCRGLIEQLLNAVAAVQ